MGGGTGRLPGSRYACIYLLFAPFRLHGKNFSRMFFVPSWQTEIPAKAGQFLSCKHSVPLCRGDIMLSLQSVRRVKSSRIETFSCKPGMKNVPSRPVPSRPGKHPVPPTIYTAPKCSSITIILATKNKHLLYPTISFK